MYLEMSLKSSMSSKQWRKHTALALFQLVKDMEANIDNCQHQAYRGMVSCLFKKSNLPSSCFVEIIRMAQEKAVSTGNPDLVVILNKLRY